MKLTLTLLILATGASTLPAQGLGGLLKKPSASSSGAKVDVGGALLAGAS